LLVYSLLACFGISNLGGCIEDLTQIGVDEVDSQSVQRSLAPLGLEHHDHQAKRKVVSLPREGISLADSVGTRQSNKFLADLFAAARDKRAFILCEEFDHKLFKGRVVSLEFDLRITISRAPSCDGLSVSRDLSASGRGWRSTLFRKLAKSDRCLYGAQNGS